MLQTAMTENLQKAFEVVKATEKLNWGEGYRPWLVETVEGIED